MKLLRQFAAFSISKCTSYFWTAPLGNQPLTLNEPTGGGTTASGRVTAALPEPLGNRPPTLSELADRVKRRASGSGPLDSLNIVDAFVEAGLSKTKSDARRIIEQGGAYINNRPYKEITVQLTTAHLASETMIVLRSGKKKYALLRFKPND